MPITGDMFRSLLDLGRLSFNASREITAADDSCCKLRFLESGKQWKLKVGVTDVQTVDCSVGHEG